MNFHPANFRSQVRSRHATDRQTDRQTDTAHHFIMLPPCGRRQHSTCAQTSNPIQQIYREARVGNDYSKQNFRYQQKPARVCRRTQEDLCPGPARQTPSALQLQERGWLAALLQTHPCSLHFRPRDLVFLTSVVSSFSFGSLLIKICNHILQLARTGIKYISHTQGRFPLPEFTARVYGPS